MIVKFDTKYFDYSNLKETLVAVPLSIFKEKFGRSLKNLTREDIDKSYKLAIKERKQGKLINARDFMNSL